MLTKSIYCDWLSRAIRYLSSWGLITHCGGRSPSPRSLHLPYKPYEKKLCAYLSIFRNCGALRLACTIYYTVQYVWAIDQVWGQDGWILAKFFFCVFMDRDEHKLGKRMRPISSHLDRTNLVNKGFIIWLSRKFFLRDTAGSPERARWFHLARSGSQSHHAIWVILPARGASHIIKYNKTQHNTMKYTIQYAFLKV